MARILILIILFWLLYIVFKRLLANLNANSKAEKNKANSKNIVRCKQCGLFVPESESKVYDKVTYCNNPDCLSVENKNGNAEQ